MLKSTNENPAGTGGRITDELLLLRVQHADHEIDDRPRREKLAQFAAERISKEALEREPLDVTPCLGKVEPFKLLYDAAECFFGDFEAITRREKVVCFVVVLRLLEEDIMHEGIRR